MESIQELLKKLCKCVVKSDDGLNYITTSKQDMPEPGPDPSPSVVDPYPTPNGASEGYVDAINDEKTPLAFRSMDIRQNRPFSVILKIYDGYATGFNAENIYQYAVLYKQNGFLIDMLYDKLDEKYKDTLPDKVNKDHKLSYDSSIYCACRYLQNHGGYFNKYLNGASHKRSEQFFREINDFSDVKMINDIRNMDKKIDKELAENKKKSKELKRNSRGKTSSTKYTKTVKASKSTLSSGNAKTKIVRPSKGIKTRKIKPR